MSIVNFCYMNEQSVLVLSSVTNEALIPAFFPNIGMNYKILTEEELNQLEESFFHAYELDDQKNLTMNINKAKNIKKEHLRAERVEKFKMLDLEYMRAMETNDVERMTAVVAKKQLLRDVTVHVDLATSIEEIKSVKVKDYSNIICVASDLETAGYCVEGTKEWFSKVGWDFKDFVRNGKNSDDVIALKDPVAMAIVEAAYNRVYGK